MLELGMTDEQIDDALEHAPLVVAFQADKHPGAWYDVDRAKKALRALGAFKHTKGRWAGVRMRLGEGLDPWQVVWIFAPIFGWVYHDAEIDVVVRVVRTAWIEVPRKAGKALALDTPIATPSGWTTQGELSVGDAVFTDTGSVTHVVGVTDVMVDRPCFEVAFSDGESIVADANHLWRVSNRRQGRASSATEIRMTHELAAETGLSPRGDRNFSITVSGALELPDAPLPIDPYILGYWLGDGHSAGARFTCGSGDIPSLEAQISEAGYFVGGWRGSVSAASATVSCSPVSRGSQDSLQARLRSLGVLGNKHVPAEYLRGSKDQRLALLQGLMDSDGTIASRGVDGNITRCEFSVVSEPLAVGAHELILSLGLKSVLRSSPAVLNGKACGTRYRIAFTSYADLPVFRLPRKLDRQKPRPVSPARSTTRQIVSVEPVESVHVKCIQVADPSGMYLAGRSLIPTHNSTIASGISGVLLLADGEMGAEVYNAAGSTLQAGRVFEDAKRMMMTSPAAAKRVEPLKEVVRVPKTGGILRVLSRVAETAHGLNVSGAVVDEVHTLKLRRALVEAIETGTGARDQPLIVFITTADEAEEGTIYDEKHTYTRNVANMIVEDPGHYGVIWAAEDSDDPFLESTWRKANPGLGKSPTLAYMRRESKKAQASPTYFPTFCRLSLNLRRREQTRWLDINKWDALAGDVDRAKLRGKRAWAGLDLSAVSDFTAWAVWSETDREDEFDLITRFWVPLERVEDLERKLLVPLRSWIDQGLVETTEGDVIDYGAIKSAVIGDCKHFDMQRVSYDRMFAGQLVQELDEELRGVEVVPVHQTFVGLSPACKELERLLGAKAMHHGGNPVLRWMASVVEVKNDGLDNIRPVKPDRQKSVTRIDGIQAAVTGLDGVLRRVKARDKKMIVYR